MSVEVKVNLTGWQLAHLRRLARWHKTSISDELRTLILNSKLEMDAKTAENGTDSDRPAS
jgi:hypothetical protein